ncbi:TIGR03086 family metal-binding protein [Mycobacteroides abscessus]|uniref:TIGR03086 family metal-binding protein n=1 Tax=Mycobacteroides abscessus TaxID=36809 RepID=UPI000929EFEF|nr:TIGR03086 family metal-binding protein [Mycobacteroides abscessus]MDO3332558.1 TIGR03086 family metal-binding protein [Mycobacteroides abscessus subsp. bolletii]QSM90864.1 TIGR03086 family protein [Mycobacteroides abscessus subsp. bolletii]SIC83104.1 TIGR03086 family protein [Mycobacteroides abscessus subsp. bolletii]SIJ00221.1 TIGR03086 family protein [Mycobacteroides abscessus subsp. bolletii]SKT23532.1 TIGR03086 family protein [Mycobacteroides abscessus subsp. bolletii]
MNTPSDLRDVHKTAVQTSADIVSAVTRGDLRRPTPCAGWTLGDLLTHMTVQHHGFAAAARGVGGDPTVWEPATVTDAVSADPAGTYRRAVEDVLEAFAADGVLEATFTLGELGPEACFPGATAIGFHFIDYVVHGWDAARSIGAPFDLPDDVIAAAVPIALAVPDGDFRSDEGSVFARALAGAEGQDDFDLVLRHLGRSPDWAPNVVG